MNGRAAPNVPYERYVAKKHNASSGSQQSKLKNWQRTGSLAAAVNSLYNLNP